MQTTKRSLWMSLVGSIIQENREIDEGDENNGNEDNEMICGHLIRDMIRNEYVRNNVKSE